MKILYFAWLLVHQIQADWPALADPRPDGATILSVAAAAGLYVLRKKNLVPDEAMLLLWGLPGLDFVVGGARRARALTLAAQVRRAFPSPEVAPPAPPLRHLLRMGLMSAAWYPLFYWPLMRLVPLLPPVKVPMVTPP